MNNIDKKISSAFILDEPKLKRIIGLISDRFSRIDPNHKIYCNYTTKRGQNFNRKTIESVVNYDNSIKNPINNLEIEAFTENNDEIKNKCKIDYDREENKVSIKIESEDSSLTNELYDELEEQVHRSLLKDKIYLIKDKFLFILLALILTTIPGIISNVYILSDYDLTQKLSRGDIKEISSHFNEAVNSEQKINAIFEFQKKIIDNNTDNKSIAYYLDYIVEALYNYKTYLILIPIIIIVFLLKMLLSTYKGSVFSWGDYKDYHDKLVSRRNILLYSLLGSIGTGILVNAIFFAITN